MKLVKSQFLFHKNPPPRDLSIITMDAGGELWCMEKSLMSGLWIIRPMDNVKLLIASYKWANVFWRTTEQEKHTF